MLALSCHGDSRKPALVMLHGFLGSKNDWDTLISDLLPHFYCICIDLPGHGQSPALSSGASGFERVASAIQTSLSSLSIVRYHLLGYSLGGRIALHLAQAYPDNLLSLSLESSHPGLQSIAERQVRARSDHTWSEKLSSVPIESFLSLWYQQGVFAELTESKRQALIRKRSHNNSEALLTVFEPTSLAKQEDLWQLPNQLQLPCHYFVGKDDSKFSALASRWANQTNIQVHTITDAGHNVHLAAPTLFCRQLIKHLIEDAQ
ncbi:2-succinyl-6-hydroxy-2,4-cyclohexadiene-1-carboxylate synthase [Shewanella canadensis]|uniref:Putative 2-succinyl-6-hydroxy-2,4-cyclohexadiene-1-carboxylate synthase n=1 Tax=Shewanella canadensis TaxID=271096 RepID=A0A3S0KTN0_9GAMM|nr:2-succinyl-6-hydroxy-2,4-cyclohexadiene-1-carboxylate synthase [Shewanella canadensis]RTR38137.1 2-succinyl-6-hydroxy-2,4-cyclohexadiene-1-carboxylate synthase [Shewanella canadensis]